jgi:hypothetical protein
MRVTRIYTGDDGESHFQTLEAPMTERPYGFLTDWLPVTGMAYRRNHPGQDLDFHPAPRRQFVVNLFGAVELETGHGEVRRLGPGDILLADDTTGRGHISRDVEGPRRNLFLPLPDDYDLSAWTIVEG